MRRRPPVSIREADVHDIAALCALKEEVARATYAGEPALEEWISHNCGEGHYRYRIGRSGYHVLVARDREGQVVGVATMCQRGRRADMSGLYVLKRGCGVGGALSRERDALAMGLGCTSARASVFRTNAGARDFVLSRGYSKKAKGSPGSSGFREPILGVMVDHYERSLS
jgi:L-amino acid N-acyltransferase YncA